MLTKLTRWATAILLLTLTLAFLNSCASTGGGDDPSSQMVMMPGGGGGPNLGIRNEAVDDSTLTLGQGFTLDVDVYNGNFADRSPPTTLRYYRSSDSTISSSDTELDSASVSALDPDETSSESASLAAPSMSGIYYYGACVDEVAGEQDTSDDCTSSGVRVTVSGSGPNLGIRNEVVDESTLTSGQEFSFSIEVYNGNFADRSPPTTLRYYRSLDSTISSSDTELGSASVIAIDPDETSSGTQFFTIRLFAPFAGTYYYGACVDEVAGEQDTSDDCSDAVRVTVSGDAGSGGVGFTIENACSRTDEIQWNLHGFNSSGDKVSVLPEPGRVYVTGFGETRRQSVSCMIEGSSEIVTQMCYGGRPRDDSSTNFWGVGIDGDEVCDDCCSPCPLSGNIMPFSARLECN